jgi:hypothetical protein
MLLLLSLSLQDEGGKEKETKKKTFLGIHFNPSKFKPNSQIFNFS